MSANKTKSSAQPSITTHKIDLHGQVLGRIASKVANLLRGKNKPDFAYHRLMGDKVIVYNASKIFLSGQKREQKVYQRHSGYPGHLKTSKIKDLLEQKPAEVFRRAVRGMLPKNRLQKHWLKNLIIYPGDPHE